MLFYSTWFVPFLQLNFQFVPKKKEKGTIFHLHKLQVNRSLGFMMGRRAHMCRCSRGWNLNFKLSTYSKHMLSRARTMATNFVPLWSFRSAPRICHTSIKARGTKVTSVGPSPQGLGWDSHHPPFQSQMLHTLGSPISVVGNIVWVTLIS